MMESKEPGKLDSLTLMEYITMITGPVSHLKVQKLLYYVQGFHLVYYDNPIIDDDFEAWAHGPVSRKVYDSLKDKSILHSELKYVQEDGKPNPRKVLEASLTKGQLELIDEVLESYGKLSGLQLEEMTHNEEPWVLARNGVPNGDRSNALISKDSIAQYFLKVVKSEGSKA